MAHPNRRTSNQRRDKRRTHYKMEAPNVITCKVTGESHLSHRAYVSGNDLYYNGKVLIEGYVK